LRYAKTKNQKTNVYVNKKLDYDKEYFDINKENEKTIIEDSEFLKEKVVIIENDLDIEENEEISFDNIENIIFDTNEHDLLIIDHFWEYISTYVHKSNINQNKKWRTITNQWLFTYYGNNDYFQNKFWDFFSKYKPSKIRLGARYNVVYPFLVKISNLTSAETRIKHDVVNLIIRYGQNKLTIMINEKIGYISERINKKSIFYKLIRKLAILVLIVGLFFLGDFLLRLVGTILEILGDIFNVIKGRLT